MTVKITTGWLRKETHGPIKRFERRWVVVSANSLSYFKKDDNSAAPLGAIDLPGKRIHSLQDTDNGFKFELADKDEIFNFSCETKSEREKWVDAISCISYGAYGGGMFGTSIETTVKREQLHGGGHVPKIIAQCIGYLDNPLHLKENGIFRLPGNERFVKQLKMEFQQGSEPNLAIKGDTHTIGSLLKLYLRSLPDSIIPSILYEDFVSIILTYDINEREGINELKYLINKIPCSNYNTLRRLCGFLYKVQTYSDSNRMDLNNLAIVFSPTVLKNNSGDLSLEMSDMQKLKRVTEIMILKQEVLFPSDKEEEVEDTSLMLENIDPDTLKNLYTVKMIKYQVQAREIASKDKDIQDLQRKLAEAEIVIQEQQNKINHMEGHVKRLENTLRYQAAAYHPSPPASPPPPPQGVHQAFGPRGDEPTPVPHLHSCGPTTPPSLQGYESIPPPPLHGDELPPPPPSHGDELTPAPPARVYDPTPAPPPRVCDPTPVAPPRSARTTLSTQKTPPNSSRNSLNAVESPNYRRRSQPVTKDKPTVVKPRPSTMYQPGF